MHIVPEIIDLRALGEGRHFVNVDAWRVTVRITRARAVRLDGAIVDTWTAGTPGNGQPLPFTFTLGGLFNAAAVPVRVVHGFDLNILKNGELDGCIIVENIRS